MWVDNQFAAGHTFAHIVIGITHQAHFQTTGIPDPEALTGCAGKTQSQWMVSHALIAVMAGNIT